MRTRINFNIKHGVRINLPIIIIKEDNWFVALVPTLGVAAQGKTLDEVKENMSDLLGMYFTNPHTPKPKIKTLVNANIIFSTISVNVPKGVENTQSNTAV